MGVPDRVTGEGMSVGSSRYRRPTKQDSVDLHVDGTFDAIGRKHELVFGLMHSRLNEDRYTAGAVTAGPPSGSFFEWDGSYPEPAWTPLVQNYDDKIRQYAAYGAVRLSLADPVKLIAGFRYSKWKNNNSGTIRVHEKFTPYVGAIVDITKQLSVYASYTSIFDPQDYRDRNGRYLDPIVGKNYEAGIKGEFLDGRLNASLAVFQTEQDNVAEQDGTHLVPGTTEFAYIGVKGVKAKGFEAEISGEIAEGWQLSAGFARAAPKQPDGTIFASNVPRNKLNLFTSYRFGGALEGLTLGGGGRWVSSAYRNIWTPAGTVQYTEGDYAIVDLMARYEFRKGMSVQINADNILNKKYYQHLGYYGGVFGLTRNVTARLAVAF